MQFIALDFIHKNYIVIRNQNCQARILKRHSVRIKKNEIIE